MISTPTKARNCVRVCYEHTVYQLHFSATHVPTLREVHYKV